MSKGFQIILFLVGVVILSSCGSSNEVVSNRLIQKRKYNTGWFVKRSGQSNKKSSPSEIRNEMNASKLQKEVESVYKTKPDGQDRSIELSVASHASEPVHFTGAEVVKSSASRVRHDKVDHFTAVEEASLTEPAITKSVQADDEEVNPEEKNKVAIASFVFLILAALIIAFGFAVMISTETFFILTFGLALFLTSLVLSILALTKFKHQGKSKVFAKITLYMILIGPVLWLIIGFIALKANSSFF